jgi:hypothetical protein
MTTFLTPNREGFEEEFHGEERLDVERAQAIVDELKIGARQGMGSTWLKICFDKDGKTHTPPLELMGQAFDQLADETREWQGFKTRREEYLEKLHKDTNKLRANKLRTVK